MMGLGMNLEPELRQILACPECGQSLTDWVDGDEPIDGRCPYCGWKKKEEGPLSAYDEIPGDTPWDKLCHVNVTEDVRANLRGLVDILAAEWKYNTPLEKYGQLKQLAKAMGGYSVSGIMRIIARFYNERTHDMEHAFSEAVAKILDAAAAADDDGESARQ